jgi:pimeloyl-ACP methyl ester carboxylesterase
VSIKRENVIVLGEGLEQRTNIKTGKQRYSVTVKADKLAINLDPVALGAPVAQAIAHHLRERVKAIAASASPATIRAREAARRAFLRGEAWAMKRYAGGKMGARLPAQSEQLFNDSGRMAESIVANASKDGVWRVNVAGNRLSADTLNGGAAAVVAIWTRLLELVPEFADMGKIMQASDVVRARVMMQQKMITKGATVAAVKSAMDAASTLMQTGRLVAELFGG